MSSSKTKPSTNKLNANKRFDFLDSLHVDQDVRSRLSINLFNILHGNPDIYETPMSREYGADRIRAEWDKVFQANKESMNEVLLELEESQRSKFGPRSVSKPWSERRESVHEYFVDTGLDYSKLDAIPQATRDRGILRPISLSKAIALLKNSTNSGLPFYTRKGKVKDRILMKFDYLVSRKDPCILFTRTQEQGKTRNVWGFPAVDTLNEMMYYKPLLDYQKKLSWRSALNGPDHIDKRITYIITNAVKNGLVLISIDFSSYDSSIKRGLIFKCFEYIKYLYQQKYSDALNYVCERMSSIGLVTPSGVMHGHHGVPSGSTFTNEIDSIAQYIIARSSGVLVRDYYDFQGDDGVYAVKEDQVVSLFNSFKRYGLDVNESKSYKSDNYLVYLQNLYHVDYMKKGVINGIYPTYRALNRILYQERWSNFEDYGIEGKDYYAIRTISILENCKHHPLYKELVSLVLKYDKYGLQPSRKGIRQYVEMLDDSSGIEGILINQYGDNVKGINSFETVKLIRKLK